jgi:Carboxypeptidase regulatory-like domain
VVAVDTLSFGSPLWLAPSAVVRVVPGPNQFTVYDVPIIVGGILEGWVRGPSGEPLGGITLVLTNATGEQRQITTFSDGAFYALGLTPGEYELTGDAEQLERRGYAAPQQRLLVPPASEEAGPVSVVVALPGLRPRSPRAYQSDGSLK